MTPISEIAALHRRYLELACLRLLHAIRLDHADRGQALAEDSGEGGRERLSSLLRQDSQALEALLEDCAGEPPPLDELVNGASLAPEESAAFTLLAGHCLIPEVAAVLERLCGEDGPPRVGMLLSVLFPATTDRLAARAIFSREGRLLRRGLVELLPFSPGDGPLGNGDLAEHRACMAAHVAGALLGEPGLPAWASAACQLERPDRDPVESLPEVLEPDEAQRLDLVLHAWEDPAGDVMAAAAPGFVLLQGPPGSGRSSVARRMAWRLGRPLLRVDVPVLLAGSGAIGGARLLDRLLSLAQFLGALPVLDDAAELVRRPAPLGRYLAARAARAQVPFVLSLVPVEDADPEVLDRALLRVALNIPGVAARRRLWEHFVSQSGTELGLGLSGEDLDRLARQFRFSPGQIRSATSLALANRDDGSEPRSLVECLIEAGRALLPARLEQYSVRIPRRLSLDDLVLPDEPMKRVREIIAACRNRSWVLDQWGFARRMPLGHGITALFDGEPGTGKTLTAQIIASELRLPLYRINMAQVVDKYVGETEKHIERIFAAAHAVNAVLLFDEADALFARRVKVDTAMDRFANLQTNTLLQEMESYDGVVLLTSNLEGNIDPAFQRRIQFRVSFPVPDARDRARLWRKLLPEEVPLEAPLPFESLGERFELSGGYIRNALLRAAYRAREARQDLSLAVIEEVTAEECKAAGKLYRSAAGQDDVAPRGSR